EWLHMLSPLHVALSRLHPTENECPYGKKSYIEFKKFKPWQGDTYNYKQLRQENADNMYDQGQERAGQWKNPINSPNLYAFEYLIWRRVIIDSTAFRPSIEQAQYEIDTYGTDESGNLKLSLLRNMKEKDIQEFERNIPLSTLRNKWSYLKKVYKNWVILKQLAGECYNEVTGTFDLTEPEWIEILEVLPEARRLCCNIVDMISRLWLYVFMAEAGGGYGGGRWRLWWRECEWGSVMVVGGGVNGGWNGNEVFKHYFDEFEEESLRDNFVVVYQLLDEMVDFGYPPQYTEAKILSKFIKTDAYRMEVNQRPPMAVTNIVSWHSEWIIYIKNEVSVSGWHHSRSCHKESSDSEEDSEELESLPKSFAIEGSGEGELSNNSSKDSTPIKPEIKFEKWQIIIRLNAIRANAEWVRYSLTQAGVSEEIAQHLAESVGLKDYDNLEPCVQISPWIKEVSKENVRVNRF
ncbi:hypothetical protein GIB67_001516, partial [Kingdonia uniflora]